MDAVDSANVLVRDIPFIAYTSEYTFLYIASRLKVLGCCSRLANPALHEDARSAVCLHSARCPP